MVHESGGDRRSGRIVEIEAYIGPDDRASHARAGLTPRTTPMFGPPGHAYVYLVYGMYDCLNIVTEPEGLAAALLVRAVEPVEGVAGMRHARLLRARNDADRVRIEALPAELLASGPGLVCAAFSINRASNGRDLCDPASPLRLEAADPGQPRRAPSAIATSPRIGVAYAGEPWVSHPWRFFDPTSPAVSGRRTRRS